MWVVRLNASHIGRSSSHPCTACYSCRSDPCTACYGSRSGPLQLHAMAGQTPVCTPCNCMLWWCNVHATHSMQLQVAWPALLQRPSLVKTTSCFGTLLVRLEIIATTYRLMIIKTDVFSFYCHLCIYESI